MIDKIISDNSAKQDNVLAMSDNEEFYAFGLPIETELGYFYPLKVREYPNYALHLQIIQLAQEQIIQNYRKLNKSKELEEIFEELEKLNLFQLVVSDQTIRHSYETVFNRCFNRGQVLHDIGDDEELFNYCRRLILRTNVMKEEKINPNPEIQASIERSKKAKSQKQEKFTLSDMVTSVAMVGGVDYREIMSWTVYQLHASFYRVANVMRYNAEILFSTVSTEKVEITDWNGHIDLFEEETHRVSMRELGKIASQIE